MSNAIQKADPHQGQVVPINDNAALMTAVANAARDPNIDVEKMERLFAMHERMEAKQAESAFNAAMSQVQAHMGRTAADKWNSQTSSNYATYAALDRALRPLYTAQGLSLSFDTEAAGDGVVGMLCHVSHIGGHTRTYRAAVPSDGKGAKGGDVMTKTHAFGSGTTYGMRYMLKMIFNVAIGDDPDDDDGNAADAPDVDQSWYDAIEACASKDELHGRKREMVEKYGKATDIPKALVRAYNARLQALAE